MNFANLVQHAHWHLNDRAETDGPAYEDQLVHALRNPPRITEEETPQTAKSVIELMKRTTSNKVRNAAAIFLTDLIGKNAKESIVDVLKRPEIARASGSLLFALNDVEASLPFDVAIDLIERGSLEAQGEVLTFIEESRIDSFTHASYQFAKDRLTALEKQSAIPNESNAAAIALELLSALHPQGE